MPYTNATLPFNATHPRLKHNPVCLNCHPQWQAPSANLRRRFTPVHGMACRMRVYDLPPDALHAAPSACGTDATDTLHALSITEDNICAALRMPVGETVYDYCWYPCMSALDPVTCCFAASARVREWPSLTPVSKLAEHCNSSGAHGTSCAHMQQRIKAMRVSCGLLLHCSTGHAAEKPSI